MTIRLLDVDARKCTGCMLCRMVCAMVKTGVDRPDFSRIRILTSAENRYLPVACRHCEEAPCLAACPQKAITRDAKLGRVVVDYGLCISCRMCQAVCPFGAIGFDGDRQTVFKCDLCGGDPVCARYCFPGALQTLEDDRQADPQVREAAKRQVVRMNRR